MQNNQSSSQQYVFVSTFNNTGELLPINNLQNAAPADDPTQCFVDRNTNTKYIIKEIEENNTNRNTTGSRQNSIATINGGSSSANSAVVAADKNTDNEIELGTFYFCEFCNASFSAKENIGKHIRFRNTGIYTCNLCCLIYCSKNLLFKHISDEHPLYCNVCVSLYSSKDVLDRHSRVHSKEEFKCKFCSKLCFNEIELKLHIMQPKHCCNDCRDLFFCTFDGLIYHQQRIHKIDTSAPETKPISAITATNTTSTTPTPSTTLTTSTTPTASTSTTPTASTSTTPTASTSIITSTTTATASDTLSLTCDICMVQFANKQLYSNHKYRKFKCGRCSEIFCTKEDHENHIKSIKHLTQKRKKKPVYISNNIQMIRKALVYCQICKLKMPEEQIVQHHSNHIKCYICLKNYSFMSELNEHLANHTIYDLLTNKYECKVCIDNFPSFSYLQEHINTVHVGNKNADNDIIYEDWRKDYEIQKLRVSNNIHWEEANCILAKVWIDIEKYRRENETTWQKARLQYL